MAGSLAEAGWGALAMTEPLSQDFRLRFVRAVSGGSSIHQAAARIAVSASAAIKLMGRVRATGSTAPARIGGDQQPLLGGHEDVVREVTSATPGITLAEIKATLAARKIAAPTWRGDGGMSVPKPGKLFSSRRRHSPETRTFARLVSTALKASLRGQVSSIKIVAGRTVANERTVKHWFAGSRAATTFSSWRRSRPPCSPPSWPHRSPMLATDLRLVVFAGCVVASAPTSSAMDH